jgi:hypothetical protein
MKRKKTLRVNPISFLRNGAGSHETKRDKERRKKWRYKDYKKEE